MSAGIGAIAASALIASITDAKGFDNGRQLAAWLELLPKQHSSGGKAHLLGISKRGDTYLRTFLIHGARSVIYHDNRPLDACGCASALAHTYRHWRHKRGLAVMPCRARISHATKMEGAS